MTGENSPTTVVVALSAPSCAVPIDCTTYFLLLSPVMTAAAALLSQLIANGSISATATVPPTPPLPATAFTSCGRSGVPAAPRKDCALQSSVTQPIALAAAVSALSKAWLSNCRLPASLNCVDEMIVAV